jgi:hypothetical protein
MVREERITAAVDAWLELLTDPDHVEATVAAVLAADGASSNEPSAISLARRRQRQLETELDRVLAAIRAGMDPVLAAGDTRKIQAEMSVVAATIAGWESSQERARPLTENEVRQAIGGAGQLVPMLASADRVDRSDLYRALGLHVRYTKRSPNRAGTSPRPVGAKT